MMSKIQMITPLVELDGDEMTRVFWPVIDTIESGYMTGDLAAVCEPEAIEVLDFIQFLDMVAERLQTRLSS